MEGNYICLFPYFWKFTFFKRMFENNFNGKISDWLQIFIILIDILSQPWALLGSNIFIIANISFSVTWKDLILLRILYEKDGKHCIIYRCTYRGKKVIKNVCFFTKVWNHLIIDKETWYCWEFFYFRVNGLI